MKKILELFTGGFAKSAADIVDRFVMTKEEKAEAKALLEQAARDFTLQAYQAEVADRDSARSMYKEDSSLQKIFAIVFLIAYIAITGFLLYMVLAKPAVELSEFGITLISTLFGAMSTKVSTITDFLFGGSIDKKKEPEIKLPK